MMVSAVIATHT